MTPGERIFNSESYREISEGYSGDTKVTREEDYSEYARNLSREAFIEECLYDLFCCYLGRWPEIRLQK